MINPRSRTAKARIHAMLIRHMVVIEAYSARLFRASLKRQLRSAAAIIAEGSHDMEQAVEKERDRIDNIMKAMVKRSVTVFGKLMFDDIEKSVMPGERKQMDEVFWSRMEEWLNIYAAEKVVAIQETTKRTIKKVLSKGAAEQWSNREIAKKLRDLSEISTGIRARRIARTETHTGACTSMNTAAGSTGIVKTREWDAADDERTRDDHRIIDKENGRIRFDEYYKVGGELLKYPGDPSGSAKNIINCRCVEMFYTD